MLYWGPEWTSQDQLRHTPTPELRALKTLSEQGGGGFSIVSALDSELLAGCDWSSGDDYGMAIDHGATPEVSRPLLGALLLGYYTEDGTLTYAGRVGTGMADKVLADLHRRLEQLSRAKSPSGHSAVTHDPLRLAAGPFPYPLGRSEACHRGHLSDVDSGRVALPYRVRGASGGQAGGSGQSVSDRY